MVAGVGTDGLAIGLAEWVMGIGKGLVVWDRNASYGCRMDGCKVTGMVMGCRAVGVARCCSVGMWLCFDCFV